MNSLNQSKARCRKLAWMREIDIYPWFIVHTDWMDDLMPRINPVPVCNFSLVPMGLNQLANKHTGPPLVN